MAGVAAVLTAFFLYIAGAITEPPKTILYAGLEPRDAAAVTAKLDGMNVKYDAKERRHDPGSRRPGDQAAHGAGPGQSARRRRRL